MSAATRRLVFRIAALALSAVILFASIELALRVLGWPAPGLYQNGRGPLALSMPDADGSSWRAYRGAAHLRHWDYDVAIQLNDHGFIERDLQPKPPGSWRIGVFGDSFTAGMGVAPDERFTQLWSEALAPRTAAAKLEVYNFGSAWCGSAQNALFLARHADEYELDEVVLAIFGGNELEDNLAWSSHAALPPDERRRADEMASSGRSLRDWIRNHSRAAGFLWVTLAGRFGGSRVQIADAEHVARLWPTTEQALDAFLEAAGSRPTTLWYLPDSHEWDDEVWRGLKLERGLRDSDRHVVRDAVEDYAKTHRLPFVDVTPALAGRSIRELRFLRDGHWTAAGHRLVAVLLAQTSEASAYQRGPTSQP